jgi:hypothetical protein
MQKGDEICGEGLSVLVLGDFPLVEWYRDTTWLAQWQPQVVKNQTKIKCVSQGVFYFFFSFSSMFTHFRIYGVESSLGSITTHHYTTAFMGDFVGTGAYLSLMGIRGAQFDFDIRRVVMSPNRNSRGIAPRTKVWLRILCYTLPPHSHGLSSVRHVT